MSPIEIDFEASGEKSTQTMVLENNSNKVIAVSIDAYERSMDIKGKETRVSTKDFVVFPQQRSLQPQEKRSFRIMYVGKKELKSEKSYRLHVKQLPIQLDVKKGKKAQVQLSLNVNYMASLYVAPEDVKENLALKLISKSKKSDKLPKLRDGIDIPRDWVKVRVDNTGSRHAILRDYEFFILKSDERLEKVDKTTLGHHVAGTNILANSKRELFVGLPKNTYSKKLKLVLKKKEQQSRRGS